MSIIEEYGDLFEIENDWALAHCVGSDFVMGKGIASFFKQKYGNQDWLLKNCRGIGTCILLPTDKVGRNVFYLVTKKWSRYSKPTYGDIEASICEMFEIAKKNNINKIAMPRIGCGLDGLNWNIVKDLIIKFKPKNMHICVKYI